MGVLATEVFALGLLALGIRTGDVLAAFVGPIGTSVREASKAVFARVRDLAAAGPIAWCSAAEDPSHCGALRLAKRGDGGRAVDFTMLSVPPPWHDLQPLWQAHWRAQFYPV